MQYQSSCAPKLARKCGIEHWLPCGADGRAAGGRAVFGHVITKFSEMGRFTYPWCSAGALRAPELRYETFSDVSCMLYGLSSYYFNRTTWPLVLGKLFLVPMKNVENTWPERI